MPPGSPRDWTSQVAAAVCPLLYLAFVVHYATNNLQGDDWNMAPFTAAAMHGHFSLGRLWSQYGETRIPLIRLTFLGFNAAGLGPKAIVLFSAILLIVAYWLLLLLVRRYLGRLTAPCVLVVGAVWFSLAAVQAALWAFEVGWYLVLFGLVAMLAALVLPGWRWLAVAVAVAVIATLGFIHGFIVWPVGLILLLWVRRSRDALVWVGSAMVTAVLYLVGYNFGETNCVSFFGCQPISAFSHPWLAARYFVVLAGATVPTQFTSAHGGVPVPTNLVRYDLVGLIVLALAVWVVVQTVRRRETFPLPLLLIAFALLFNALITYGRLGGGLGSAVLGSRYELGNMVLLSAIVVHAWRYAKEWWMAGAVAVLVAVQVVVSVSVGVPAARNTATFLTAGARVVTNLDRLPTESRSCELAHFLIPSHDVRSAEQEHLAEFGAPRKPSPTLLPECSTAKSR